MGSKSAKSTTVTDTASTTNKGNGDNEHDDDEGHVKHHHHRHKHDDNGGLNEHNGNGGHECGKHNSNSEHGHDECTGDKEREGIDVALTESCMCAYSVFTLSSNSSTLRIQIITVFKHSPSPFMFKYLTFKYHSIKYDV